MRLDVEALGALRPTRSHCISGSERSSSIASRALLRAEERLLLVEPERRGNVRGGVGVTGAVDTQLFVPESIVEPSATLDRGVVIVGGVGVDGREGGV